MIIDSFNLKEGKGLPLGNQTSQWFALYYLDHLDRTVKEKYRIKYYSRYMDDGIIISNDLELLKKLNVTLKEELEEVKLTMNEKKNHISSIKQGVTYLGFTYHLNDNGKLIVKMANKKKKRLIRYLNSYDLKEESLNTYYNYLKKNSTNNYSMMKRIYKKLDS